MRPATARAYTTIGLLAAGAGTFSWGIGVVLVKLTTSPFLIVSFYRHLFSLPIFLAAWALSRNRKSRLPWGLAGIGGVLFAVHQVANFAALRHSTAAVVTIFFSLQPILVGALGSRMTGEHVTARFYVWAVVAVGGCAILVLASAGQPHATPLGTLLAVANLLAWTAYYIATKRARAVVGTVPWLLVMTIVSGVCVGVVSVMTQQPFAAPHGTEWAYLAALGIVPGAIGHLLVTWAHPHVHAAASSVLILAVPIVATIGAAVFVHERFGPWQAVGALVAIGGAGFAMRFFPAPVTAEAATRFGEVAT
jgi:drug/metabolite transporter (DMT)-like permease